MNTNTKKLRIAVAHPSVYQGAETFVRNHIKYLSTYADVQELSGGWLPMYADGRRVIPFWLQVINKLQTLLLRKNFNDKGTCVQYWIQYFKNQGIEALLCEFGPTGAAMLPVCQALNIPLIVHFHGSDIHTHRFIKQYQLEYAQLFAHANAIIIVSTLQQKIVAQMGCDATKIHHIACGADLSFARLPRPDFNSNPIYIAIGRLVAKKSPMNTIRAFAQIQSSVPNARLLLIGDGPLMNDCKKLVSELDCTSIIDLCGAKPHDEVVKALGTAYCFVQHSVTAADGDSEGTPVAILEAGLAGLPVVATRHAGIADVVIPNKTGFLVAENDVTAMAARMLQLANDKDLCRRMSLAATEHITTNNAMPVAIAKLWNVIEKAINANH